MILKTRYCCLYDIESNAVHAQQNLCTNNVTEPLLAAKTSYISDLRGLSLRHFRYSSIKDGELGPNVLYNSDTVGMGNSSAAIANLTTRHENQRGEGEEAQGSRKQLCQQD